KLKSTYMLSYCPKPLSDEIFASIEGRFHSNTLSRSISQTKISLFGSREVNTSLHFPTRLNWFILNAKQLYPFDVNQLIYDHTLWPYFSKFIKEEKHSAIIKMMVDGGNLGGSARI